MCVLTSALSVSIKSIALDQAQALSEAQQPHDCLLKCKTAFLRQAVHAFYLLLIWTIGHSCLRLYPDLHVLSD